MMNQVQLAEICDLVSGQSPPSSSYNQDRDGVPFFQGKADFGELYPRVRYWCTEPKKMSIPGDILFSVRAPVGPTNVNNINACLGRGLCAIRSKDRVIQKYLLHYLRANEHKIAALGTGSTFKAITIKELRSIKIPLPSLEEQKRIATILDAADELRQKDKALIAKYDEFTQSLFLDMFGDPVTNPMKWDELKLENVCTKVTDGTHHSPKPRNSGYPYVTAKHIKPFKLDFGKKPTYVDETAHNEIYKRCTPEFGDVLYIKDGATTGVACINTFDKPISMLSSLALLKLKSDIINNHYLCHWLNHGGVKEKLITQFMSGAAIKRYTLKKISSFVLPIPPFDLQSRFSEQVQTIGDQKAIAQASLNKSEDLFNSLLQKAFKGELTN